MRKLTSIPRHAAVLLVLFSAFFSPYAGAVDTLDDTPEPGCNPTVSINDFL